MTTLEFGFLSAVGLTACRPVESFHCDATSGLLLMAFLRGKPESIIWWYSRAYRSVSVVVYYQHRRHRQSHHSTQSTDWQSSRWWVLFLALSLSLVSHSFPYVSTLFQSVAIWLQVEGEANHKMQTRFCGTIEFQSYHSAADDWRTKEPAKNERDNHLPKDTFTAFLEKDYFTACKNWFFLFLSILPL